MRDITLADAPQLSQLHQLAFSTVWDAPQFESLIKSGAIGWLIEDSAFLLIRCAADEAEILTLATHPKHRRQGRASQLLQHCVAQLAEAGYQHMHLEVKLSNLAAKALYEKHNFSVTATRANYYAKSDGSREDAIMMRLDLA